MPRPNLKQQRSREILDAFVSCVARFGLDGATQERIAAEAGVKRTILRHYLGNREQMIQALICHVIAEFDALTETLWSLLPQQNSVAPLLELLFVINNGSDTRLTLVFQALVSASSEYTDAKAPLLASISRFAQLIEDELCRVFPQQTDLKRQAVAHGIVGIYLTHDALTPLDMPADRRELAHHAALLLTSTLEE